MFNKHIWVWRSGVHKPLAVSYILLVPGSIMAVLFCRRTTHVFQHVPEYKWYQHKQPQRVKSATSRYIHLQCARGLHTRLGDFLTFLRHHCDHGAQIKLRGKTDRKLCAGKWTGIAAIQKRTFHSCPPAFRLDKSMKNNGGRSKTINRDAEMTQKRSN